MGYDNVKSYIGQVLYVNGKHNDLQKYGYDYFKTRSDLKHYDSGFVYGNPASVSKYNTKYEDLYGKYFNVVNVTTTKDSFVCDLEYYVFHLVNRDDETDVVYFYYDAKYEFNFPFIVVSHFEWAKQNLIGKKFIYNCGKQMDINTGQELNLNYDDIWECIDITVETKYYNFVILLKNKKW